jgi:hypothetical protein
MITKSYLISKPIDFGNASVAPVFLGELEGRYYYAFTDEAAPPSGGKNVSADELEKIKQSSLLFKQIKRKTEEEITKVAPIWQQVNALVDLVLLVDKTDLTAEERIAIADAKELLLQVRGLRDKSNNIETGFLNGQATDYLNDHVWAQADAE